MSVPSIFNDVIGPVMRGPSSSHCAASLRIGRICRDLMQNRIEEVLIEFDPNGSLATTHEGQGSDMGLFGGFLGWEAHDDRLQNYREAIEQAGISYRIEITPLRYDHPNTYQITLKSFSEQHQLIALSTGGGMIEVIEIDGATVNMAGDYFETLIYAERPEPIAAYLRATLNYDEINVCKGKNNFVELKAQEFPSQEILAELESMEGVTAIRKIHPVLPVLARGNLEVPFLTSDAMLEYNQDKQLTLWELAVHYESARGGITHDEVIAKAKDIAKIMRSAIENGLAGTRYEDRILGAQSPGFQNKMQGKQLIKADVLNRIIMSVTAIMETKSSMGVIVAAPTAGSCGAMPGTVLAVADHLGASEEEAAKAVLAAGLIGVFITAHATFAAEVGGCQAECGSGSGMAAAAIAGLAGGNLQQCLTAASIALQNSFGMVCDPIANRVEAPCLGKNIMAASNALSCANIALADYDQLIPLDEVIDAMDKVGKSIPNDLRCTSLGGLADTPTARKIEADLVASGKQLPVLPVGGKFKVC